MAFKVPSHITPGLTLAAVITAVIIWLSYTNQLNLYISSRYDWFAVCMAVVSFIGIAASAAQPHDHSGPRKIGAVTIGLGVTAALLALALLLLQPRALSSSTALQRGINAGGLNLATTTNATSFGTTNYAQFDIRDWASVLTQTTDLSFYTGKTANIVGFVSPTPNNDPNVFFASRFYITCCAMDAQPYGIPVYVSDWRRYYPANSWVGVSGGFVSDPAKSSAMPIVLIPKKINSVPEPQDPYER